MTEERNRSTEDRKRLLQFPDTDTGNAEAFELLNPNRFVFDHARRKWMFYDRFWRVDNNGEAERSMLETVRTRRVAAASITSRHDSYKRMQWALGSESAARLGAALRSAQSIKCLATEASQFDRDPYLLTCGNGTLDLLSGRLRVSSPEDLITRATDVEYHPEASCPRWLQFLSEIFGSNTELIEFVWRAIGYTLTGNVREQCLFILCGEGANGKTTLLEILLRVLGTHAVTTPFATFLLQRDSGSPRNDLAALHGARMVKAAEAQQRARLNEALIKQITGGDTVTARFLYGEFFSFKPQFKPWLATNHRPDIRGTDDAMWRRMKLIPFSMQFDGRKMDKGLMQKLEAELPGILALAVKACRRWLEHGLGDAAIVTDATQEYRRECDLIGRFLEEQCVTGPQHQIGGKDIYLSFARWCNAQNEETVPNSAFAVDLVARGFTKKRTREGVIYQGLGVAPRALTVSIRPSHFTS